MYTYCYLILSCAAALCIDSQHPHIFSNIQYTSRKCTQMSFPTFSPMLTQVLFWKPLWRAPKWSHKFAGWKLKGEGDEGLQQVSLKLVFVNKFGVILLGWWIGSIPVSSFQFSHVELWLISSVFRRSYMKKSRTPKKIIHWILGRKLTDYRWLYKVPKQVRYVSTCCAYFFSPLDDIQAFAHSGFSSLGWPSGAKWKILALNCCAKLCKK